MNILEYLWEEKVKKVILHPQRLIIFFPLTMFVIYYFAKRHFIECVTSKLTCMRSELVDEYLCNQPYTTCTLPDWWNILKWVLIILSIIIVIINWIRIIIYQWKKHLNKV